MLILILIKNECHVYLIIMNARSSNNECHVYLIIINALLFGTNQDCQITNANATFYLIIDLLLLLIFFGTNQFILLLKLI